MESVFQTLNQVYTVSSTLQKYDILKSDGSSRLKDLLMLAYNPFKQYYIKKVPEVPSAKTDTLEDNWREFVHLLDDLSGRVVTGNAAIERVAAFLKRCNWEEQYWYTRVLQKDLDIGIADKGINKVFKGLIPTYNVMLADKVTDLSLSDRRTYSKLPDRMVVQYKIDGYRLNIHRPDKNTVIIRTRNGKEVHGYADLEKSALELPVGYVYDGELVAPELYSYIQSCMADVSCQRQDTNISATERHSLNRQNRDLFSEAMSHAFSKETDKKGIFNLFDVVPCTDWSDATSVIPYSQRLKLLDELVLPDNILVVPTSKVFYKARSQDLEEITKLFYYYLQIGWEGALIKDYDSYYQWKRTKSMLKMKLMDTMDLEVVDVYEGTGRNTDKLGGVMVNYEGNLLSVGSGFTDEQREYWWSNPEAIKGKTIEIAYQAVTHNKTGGTSVSFPVFKGIREDK